MSTPPNGPSTGTPDATAPSTGPSAEPSTIPPTDPSAHPPVGRSRPHGGTLALRPRGLWLVTSLELRQRIRSARWYVALGIWTLLLFGIGVLSLAPALYTTEWGVVREVARVMFSLQMILVLFAMLLVTPALSAGSINGDRSAGTLATLQASLLSPLEIVLGKLLAGLVTGLAFLVLAMPSALPLALLGEVSIFYLLRVTATICFLTFCVTAIGLGLSRSAAPAGVRWCCSCGVRGDGGGSDPGGRLNHVPHHPAGGDQLLHRVHRLRGLRGRLDGRSVCSQHRRAGCGG